MPKPFIPVELDRQRRIRYSTNALIAMEDQMGKKVGVVIKEFNEGLFGFKDIRIMLWAGLMEDDRKLTLSKVGDIMDDVGFERAVDCIGKGFEAAFDDGEPKNEQGPVGSSV